MPKRKIKQGRGKGSCNFKGVAEKMLTKRWLFSKGPKEMRRNVLKLINGRMLQAKDREHSRTVSRAKGFEMGMCLPVWYHLFSEVSLTTLVKIATPLILSVLWLSNLIYNLFYLLLSYIYYFLSTFSYQKANCMSVRIFVCFSYGCITNA